MPYVPFPWEYEKINKALEEARAKWGKAELVKAGERVVIVTPDYPDGYEVYFRVYQSFRCPGCGALYNVLNLAAEHYTQHHLPEPSDAA